MSENFHDPLNRPPRTDEAPVYLTRQQTDEDGGSMWGWIAGLAVLALVAAFIFGGSNNSQMADQGAGTVPGVTRSTEVPSSSSSGGLVQPSSPSATPAAPSPSTTGSGASTTGSGSSQ